MESHIVSRVNPIPASILPHIASTGVLNEISNHPGAVRHHIYHHGILRQKRKTSRQPLLFFVYQTARYGPQNGFRLCIVHADYVITSDIKPEDDAEDDIDRLEAPIPQGHMEVVVLGRGLREFIENGVEVELDSRSD